MQPIKRVVWVCMAAIWSAAAMAAENALTLKQIRDIPMEDLWSVLTLAIIGGTCATLKKVSAPDYRVKNIWLELAKDFMMSILAGGLAFALVQWSAPDKVWLQVIVIALAGYGGSRVIDRLLEEGMFAWLSRMTGGMAAGTPPKVKSQEETLP